MLRVALYARVSTNDQQTLAMQNRAMREYAARRAWRIALHVREVNSGAARREAREKLLRAARRREIDLVLVWRLDWWGRSVTDLLATLQELDHLGVGFVSLTEALDLTTPAERAMAAMLAVFAAFEREVLQERTRAGLAHARQNGKRLGRPATAAVHAAEIRKLHRAGVSKSEIARRNRSSPSGRPHVGAPYLNLSGGLAVRAPRWLATMARIRRGRKSTSEILDWAHPTHSSIAGSPRFVTLAPPFSCCYQARRQMRRRFRHGGVSAELRTAATRKRRSRRAPTATFMARPIRLERAPHALLSKDMEDAARSSGRLLRNTQNGARPRRRDPASSCPVWRRGHAPFALHKIHFQSGRGR
jgi:putative DNA-invertase from lambdoid prophage Rac